MTPAHNSNNLINSLSTAVLLLDTELTVQYANQAAEALLQHSTNQLLHRQLLDFFVPGCIDEGRLQHCFHSGESFSDNDLHLFFPGGQQCFAALTVSLVDENHTPLLLLEINPMDQQRKLTLETQQWQQQQAAKELIRGLAHEIKNPLGGLRGAAQLLDHELQDQSQREFTQMIIEQADRLRNMVDRLLGPNVLPQFQWFNVHRVIEKVMALMRLENSASLLLNRDYDPSIPDLWIDPDMLQQAVLNIARNAVQAFNGHGEVRFVTRVQRQLIIHGQRFPLCVEIQIIDNGPGVPQELRDTLFFPMVTSKKEGSGLGLSIAQSLVAHHRGKIEVESRPGHTNFTLYLPIDKKEPK